MKGYAFIGLNLIGVLIFWTVPMLFSFIISISKWDYSKGIKGIRIQGFSNYVEMWRDAWFRASLINNIVFTVSYVAVLIVLSFMVAYVLNEYVVGKKFVQLGLYLPYIVNIVAISAVWLALFSNNGPILNLLRKIGMENPPVFVSDLRWALPAIVLICIWQNLGYTVILFLSGMINVPRDLYEAAAIDGANGIARINLMTHGGPGTATTMLVYNIYRTAFQFGKLEFASAQGIVLLAIIFFITWIQFRIQKRNEA